MNDTQSLIGKLIEGVEHRDAIHIAVAPVVAKHEVLPGQHVNANGEGLAPLVGIVDPFLTKSVMTGQSFWLFLYPNTITGLRHDWAHSDFAQEGRIAIPAGVSKEEVRLHEIAAAIGIGYGEMMNGADDWVHSSVGGKWGGDYLVQQGSEYWRETFPHYNDEFWRLYEIVRDKTVPDEHKESFFSCSC